MHLRGEMVKQEAHRLMARLPLEQVIVIQDQNAAFR